MRAVIPAAGAGTRLRPLTADRPKGLVDVAGKTLLARVFDAVLPLPIEAFVVVIGYQGTAIIEHFGEAYRGTPIRYVHQRDRRGLGHAVRLAEPYVESTFVVVNGDNVIDADLSTIIEHHRTAAPVATVPYEQVALAAARETGVLVIEDGEVRAIVEKPATPPATTAMTGIVVAEPVLFEALAAIEPSDRGEFELADGLDRLIHQGRRVDAVRFPGWRHNVNTPEDVDVAARHLGAE